MERQKLGQLLVLIAGALGNIHMDTPDFTFSMPSRMVFKPSFMSTVQEQTIDSLHPGAQKRYL